jgi:phage baseplate assembly protein W
MAIKIKSLEAEKISKKALDKQFLYKDVFLDIETRTSFNSQLNRQEQLNDIQALYDVEAVKNSIRTAFLTAPGDKILNPTYGMDLREFLFEPISDFTTDIIRDKIEDQLPIMEPRITVENVDVIGDPDNNQYNIYLQINIPSLNIYGVNLKSTLNSVGYTIV